MSIENNNTTHLSIDADVSIEDIEKLKASLEEALSSEQNIMLDVSETCRIDTPSLQLLSVFCKAASEKGLDVTWEGIRPEFEKSVMLLDLAEALKLQPVQSQAEQ